MLLLADSVSMISQEYDALALVSADILSIRPLFVQLHIVRMFDLFLVRFFCEEYFLLRDAYMVTNDLLFLFFHAPESLVDSTLLVTG